MNSQFLQNAFSHYAIKFFFVDKAETGFSLFCQNKKGAPNHSLKRPNNVLDRAGNGRTRLRIHDELASDSV